MTTSSLDPDRMTGQVSSPNTTATLAAGALMLTSAILTFLVGVFALAANDLVVSGPGYEYTFQLSGWGWANILTGMVLAGVGIGGEWAMGGTFLWMPYYPTGAIVLIAPDVVVIWGVATWNTSRQPA